MRPHKRLRRCSGFSANGVQLRIQKVEKVTPPPFTALGWEVPSIRRAMTVLLRTGVTFERYPFLEQDESGVWNAPGGTKVAWFKDPDGNLLSLAENGAPFRAAGELQVRRSLPQPSFDGAMSVTKPSAVSAFLAGLPEDRRPEVDQVREVILHHLPAGYEEAIVKGILVYQVPLARYPDTYNGHALWYVALASEKSYLSLHLMNVYADPGLAQRLREGFKAAGKKLDMGKSCVHFKRAADLPLDLIGALVAAVPLERWVAVAKAARRRPRAKP